MNAALLRAVNAVSNWIAPAVPGLGLQRAAAARARAALPAELGAQRVTFRFGLSGLRWGTGGPVVLMVHGRDGRPAQFRHFVEPLLASGRQVVALEGPAAGGAIGSDASVAELALAIGEAAVELDGLEAVIGHGTGAAAVALALATGLHVQRAVLIAAPARPETGIDLGRTVRTLRVPALIVHDGDDPEAPFADGDAIAAAWPDARLLATTRLGHWRVLGDATVVHGVAEFLRGHDAGLTRAALRRASA